ncbi:hypothetical protein ACIBQ1_56425 [Nonomuraea sp. NPDC050153]|uniref:hypothetical protein n=1 Tax=Nonomuraea sp. NPDC050153 TaxID=3364359 RepID=UPI0037992371
MNVALWAIAGALAAVFLLAGGMKLLQPKETTIELIRPAPAGIAPVPVLLMTGAVISHAAARRRR